MTVYSSLKMFHFQEKLDSLPYKENMRAPIHVRIKPTNLCNHRCRYCAYRAPDLQLGQDMREQDSIPKDKMLEIVKDMLAMGVKAVTFSGGGEPLLYPYIVETANLLHDGGIAISSLSNGALLVREKAEFFAHNGTWLRVSMDGWDNASYSKYRGVKHGEYTKIMNNLESFSALGGKCALGVSYIVDNENWKYVPIMLQRFKDVGVGSVKISACIISNDAQTTNDYHAPHFVQTQKYIEQAKDELADENFEIVDSWHTLDDRFGKQYTWCPFSQVLMVIGADCKVYPCQDKAYNDNAILGDLGKQSFKQFIETGKDNFFKLNPKIHCKHHCVANAKNQMLMEYLNVDNEHGLFV